MIFSAQIKIMLLCLYACRHDLYSLGPTLTISRTKSLPKFKPGSWKYTQAFPQTLIICTRMKHVQNNRFGRKYFSLAVSSVVSCGLTLNLRFPGRTLMKKINESTISSVFEQIDGANVKNVYNTCTWWSGLPRTEGPLWVWKKSNLGMVL